MKLSFQDTISTMCLIYTMYNYQKKKKKPRCTNRAREMNNALEPHVYCNLILGLINVSFFLWRKEKEQTKTREKVSSPPNFVWHTSINIWLASKHAHIFLDKG